MNICEPNDDCYICNQNLNDTKMQCYNNFICDICIFKIM